MQLQSSLSQSLIDFYKPCCGFAPAAVPCLVLTHEIVIIETELWDIGIESVGGFCEII